MWKDLECDSSWWPIIYEGRYGTIWAPSFKLSSSIYKVISASHENPSGYHTISRAFTQPLIWMFDALRDHPHFCTDVELEYLVTG